MKTTKGNKITIDFGTGRKPTFTAGGRKRHLLDEVRYSASAGGPIGVVMVNGIVRFADGTEAYALLEIDESSSGEHCGTGVFLPDGGFTWQDDTDFCKRIGKPSDKVFPYKYKYTGAVRALSDHHIGNDGWSL